MVLSTPSIPYGGLALVPVYGPRGIMSPSFYFIGRTGEKGGIS